MDPALAPTPTLLHQAEPFRHTAANINISIQPTAKESERPQQHRYRRPFVKKALLSSFLNTPIPHWQLLLVVSNLYHGLQGLGLTQIGKKIVEKLLQTIMRISHCW